MGNNCCSLAEDDLTAPSSYKQQTFSQGYFELVSEKYRLRRLPVWGTAGSGRGTTEVKKYPEHRDLCTIINECGLTFRLEYLDFVQVEGFVPDGLRFPLGEIRTSYQAQAKLGYNKGERSRGRRLVMPDNTIDHTAIVRKV